MANVGGFLAGAAVAGLAGLAYARWEAQNFTLRRADVEVLPSDAGRLRVLHLSDLHLVPGQLKKREWVSSLRELKPDAVVATGDFLSHEDAIADVISTLEPLSDIPAAFVLGSNDYFAPKPLNPAKYLRGPSQVEPHRPMLPWGDLVKGLVAAGWVDLSNARTTMTIGELTVDLRGVDDPHIGRDRYAEVAGPSSGTDFSLGVTHAPYLRVIDAMADDGADLILAGHTHGGQLRVPGYGALVTNCDLDTKRARGLSTHRQSAMHVSAGLGTSPYAPFRFACPPEATLLTLVARR